MQSLIRYSVSATFFGIAFVSAMAHAQAEHECVIQPRQILEIRSPVDGLIQRVHVDRGQTVRRGQLLATLDDSVERVAAEGARHRAGMMGAVQAGESRVTATSRKLERVQELIASKFLSAQALDDAQNEKRLAEAELVEARDARRLAEIEFNRQNAIIQLKSIRSPVNGVVVERLLNAGELSEAGVGRRAILKIAEIDVLHVEALLPAEAWSQVKVGLAGEVQPAIGGGTHRARVAVVDRILDAGSGTFGVRLELPNPGHAIPAGTRCRLRLEGVDVPARRSAAPSTARP
jgi:RND family efflux transporter MFP subunit